MEKKRINILCLFLIGLFLFAVYDSGTGIVKSVSDSMGHVKNMKGMEKVHVTLLPDNKYTFIDMFDGASPSGLLFQMKEINLAVPETDAYGITSSVLLLVATPLLLFFLFWSPYSFLCFIQDIKRGRIFVRDNVKRLRIIGALLLILGVMINVLDTLDYYFLLQGLDLKIQGYQVVKFEFHYTALMVALLFILFAEIFSMGVHMKEEQDLTV